DLEASINRKIRGWREPGVRFLVARDQDGADCVKLKARLADLVPANPRPEHRIRIVCQELESWLLGDIGAIADAYPQARKHASFRTWSKRDPDSFTNAADMVANLTGTKAKTNRAKEIAARMTDLDSNRSHSFQVFLQ